MTPDKRVEEVVEEFRAKAISMQEQYTLPTTPDYYDDELCDWLTTTLTQLVKEVEEGERDKTKEIVMDLYPVTAKQTPEQNREHNRIRFPILQALTPPTSDVIEK